MSPIVLLLAAVGFALFALSGNAFGDTTMQISNTNITANRNTWPSGGKIWALCQAIAHAEGYDVEGSVPNRFNNPGDLSPADANGYPSQFEDGSNVASIPSAAEGWTLLYHKISRISSGGSSVYPLSFTFYQMSQEYAGDSQDWLNNVLGDLNNQGFGVSANTTLRDFFA